MRKFFLIIIVGLLSGCFESSYHRNYIISQYSEEENQEPPQEIIDMR